MDHRHYGLTVDHQVELGEHNKTFWDALKSAERKFGEGKQAMWDAGAAAKEMRALVPHGHWEDYCRNALGHDPAWIWRLIKFRESCSYVEAGDVKSVRAYLSQGAEETAVMDDPFQWSGQEHLDPNDEYAYAPTDDSPPPHPGDDSPPPSSNPPDGFPTQQSEPEVHEYVGGVEIQTEVEDVTDEDVQPDIEAKPVIGGRLSKVDALQLEVKALEDEVGRRDAAIESVQGELFKVRDVYDQAKQALNKERMAKQRLQQQLTRKDDELEDLKVEKQQLAASLDAARDQYKDLMDIIVRNDLDHILPRAE
ncbi:MAG: hypothetical protein OXH56_00150 [Gemmatimonadetes bacterium]|nr:hypothetical protein [Gemmatimonadota bacterium]